MLIDGVSVCLVVASVAVGVAVESVVGAVASPFVGAEVVVLVFVWPPPSLAKRFARIWYVSAVYRLPSAAGRERHTLSASDMVESDMLVKLLCSVTEEERS